MRSRTAPLVYLKFYAQIRCFSWATRDWTRGWNSRQVDRVKIRRPRHLKRSYPSDNHFQICQLSVLSTWLIAWVLLAQRMQILLLSWGILADEHCTLFNHGHQRCPSDSGISVKEVKILILMAMPPGCFGFQCPSKTQAGAFLGFATLEQYAYRSILMIGHRRFAVVEQTMVFIHALFPLTACTVGHLWIRLVPSPTTAQPESEWAILISDDSGDDDQSKNAALDPLHKLVVLSQPFSTAAAEVSTSESDPVDFDNKVAEEITHLDKVDLSSLASCSRKWLSVLATITSESSKNGGDEDLGISDDWIADDFAFQKRASYCVWQPSFSNYFGKSDSLSKPKTWYAPINTSFNS